MKRSMILLASLLLAACSSSAGDQAADSDAGDVPSATGDTPGSATNAPAPGSDGGATIAPTGDGGSQPPTNDPDGGAPAAGDSGGGGSSASGVFGGDAGAYVPTLGTLANNPKHTGNPNPAGQACLSCHGGQKPNVVRFLFAGTTWSAGAPATAAAQVEVRIVESNGVAHSTYSDANGNFFFKAAGEALSPPAMGAVRDSNGAASMTNVFNDGDCNSCHHAGGEGPILAP